VLCRILIRALWLDQMCRLFLLFDWLTLP
jgi:hypothetical protein